MAADRLRSWCAVLILLHAWAVMSSLLCRWVFPTRARPRRWRRIIARLSEPYEIDGHQAVIGASVGIAIGQDNCSTPDQLVRNADLALYGAKADGRGTIRFFEAEMHAQVQERLNLEQSLRNALAAGEFELHYQPLVNVATNAITGLEALIRWHHPDKGLLAPDAFIPLAEEIGLINPIGEWVMRKACTTAAKWPGHLKSQ